MLNRLKNSLRNCKERASLNRIFLKSEKSKFTSPGPYRISRPAFPYLNCAGVWKAFVSKKRLSVRWSREREPPPVRSARFPVPVLVPGEAKVTVNGRPLCNEVMPLICQPPTMRGSQTPWLTQRFPFPRGSS